MKEQEDLLARTASKEESIVSSLRLAYKDLEIQMKKEEKMNMSGQKKVESERLGMGFGNCRSGISHSVTSDMQTIEQETPVVAKPRKSTVMTMTTHILLPPQGTSTSRWN